MKQAGLDISQDQQSLQDCSNPAQQCRRGTLLNYVKLPAATTAEPEVFATTVMIDEMKKAWDQAEKAENEAEQEQQFPSTNFEDSGYGSFLGGAGSSSSFSNIFNNTYNNFGYSIYPPSPASPSFPLPEAEDEMSELELSESDRTPGEATNMSGHTPMLMATNSKYAAGKKMLQLSGSTPACI
ncbi:Protein of unknown function [Pyronema omphalodes CBS 100304]|uniref:Uncharacterized protein n=1 Tax=Pyronema omphalodes (strain CBS 100304) TaxID=1076935 RepID=U4L769_PYROM|nr:Protein of unknown function [Pyronema omphalodes CBS 100304]